MTASSLAAALRAAADGLYAIEAATGLIIAHGTWLAREDFTRFIHVGTSISDPGTELASIDWEAAIRAFDAGELPSSGGERRMLRLAASLADQAPVSLGDAITGIDDRNADLLVGSPPCIRTTPVPPIARRAYRPPERFRTIWRVIREAHEEVGVLTTVNRPLPDVHIGAPRWRLPYGRPHRNGMR